jgi:hypothetical protein
MRIKTSGQTHTIYRYAGQSDGKTFEAKIGTVIVGTKPDEVPSALADNLTPKELRELAELLRREQLQLARKTLDSLAAQVELATGLITTENLDEQTAEKLAPALSRCKAAVSRVQRSRQSSGGPNVQTPAEATT